MIDLFGIGNALVDFESKITETFLDDHLLEKGHMYLKDEAEIGLMKEKLTSYFKMSSGGSAANTIYGASGFGLSCAYCCRVQDDEAGGFFVREMKEAGVHLDDIRQECFPSKSTGSCLVLITQDAQRTMCTNLGISSELSVEDLNLNHLKSSRYLYVEGYLAASETSSQAAQRAIEVAKEHGIPILLTLSDVSMVNFFRSDIEKFCASQVNTIFCNEEEALCWAGTDRLEIAFKRLKEIGKGVHVTVGSKGSLVCGPEENPREVIGFDTEVNDTNGAGDMYAAAALSLIVKGFTHVEAARFGNYAAAQIVRQYGARL
ncbi:MAG: adenosine kinase, partial [Pseudomonadota bacterium]|nr:adenosine kinase [Pseudomonadota bacterium]